MNSPTPAPSRTAPVWAYVSRPNEWAKPPDGNNPSASWSTASSPSVMTMPSADGSEDRVVALPRDVEAPEQLLHRRVVGHEEPVTVDGQREVTVADLERHAHGLVA